MGFVVACLLCVFLVCDVCLVGCVRREITEGWHVEFDGHLFGSPLCFWAVLHVVFGFWATSFPFSVQICFVSAYVAVAVNGAACEPLVPGSCSHCTSTQIPCDPTGYSFGLICCKMTQSCCFQMLGQAQWCCDDVVAGNATMV